MRKTIAIVLLALLVCSMSVSALSFSRAFRTDAASPQLGSKAPGGFWGIDVGKLRSPLRFSPEALQCVKEATPENFNELVLENAKPVAVRFYADWCGPCRMFAPVYEKVCTEYRGRMAFVAFNVDQDRSVWTTYGISGIPTVLFFSEGREYYRHVGYTSVERFRNIVKNVLGNLGLL